MAYLVEIGLPAPIFGSGKWKVYNSTSRKWGDQAGIGVTAVSKEMIDAAGQAQKEHGEDKVASAAERMGTEAAPAILVQSAALPVEIVEEVQVLPGVLPEVLPGVLPGGKKLGSKGTLPAQEVVPAQQQNNPVLGGNNDVSNAERSSGQADAAVSIKATPVPNSTIAGQTVARVATRTNEMGAPDKSDAKEGSAKNEAPGLERASASLKKNAKAADGLRSSGRIYNFKTKRLVPYEEVTLSRSNGSKYGLKFGDVIQGCGIPIKSITAGGAAHTSGRIRVNQMIVEINGIDVRRGATSLFKKELTSKGVIDLKIIAA